MKQIKFAIIAAVLGLISSQSEAADAVFVSCYSSGHSQLSLSFDSDKTEFTYFYQNNQPVLQAIQTFESSVSGGWAQHLSAVTAVSKTDELVHLKAQIIGGDSETPVIETSAEVQLAKNSNGEFILQSGYVYHFDVPAPIQEFIGQPCYVQ